MAAAEPLRVPIVMYPGQQTTHTTRQPLTAVTFDSPAQAATAKIQFDQYQDTVVLKAVKNGDAVINCETVDGRVSEILELSVVPRAQHDLHRSVSQRFTGVDGLSSSSVAIAGPSVLVAGRVYKRQALETCLDVERMGNVVCAIRLSPALAAIAPGDPGPTRASLEVARAERGWRLSVRLADVPIAAVESNSRKALLDWSVPYVRNLNDMLRRWEGSSGEAARYPPVVSLRRSGARIEIAAIWNEGKGSRQNVLASIPSDTLAAAAVTARTSPDLLVRWWAALLQDALRMYLLGERPARSSTASRPSPLLRVYEHALVLRGEPLDRSSGGPSLSRAAFALALAGGSDPLEAVPLTVPPDVRE